jgi:hydroxypyruvate reductase
MIQPPESFLTHSLNKFSGGIKVAKILSSSLAAVEPGEVVKKSLVRNADRFLIGGETLDLKAFDRIILIGIGKAGYPMSMAAADLLGDELTRGIILTKPGADQLPEKYAGIIKHFHGGHPVPNQNSITAAKIIQAQLSELNSRDLVVLLLSGGGSALLSAPCPGITLQDLILTNQVLLGCGADITEINTIRKHISLVKGGLLASISAPAKIVTLILSDVMGDPIDMIASGPTAPDPSTFQDALNVMQKFNLDKLLPLTVVDRINKGCSGEFPETPKPEDLLFQKVFNYIIGRNLDAVQAGILAAEQEGFNAGILPNPLKGEASRVGTELAEILRQMARKGKPLPRPACLIGGGETTVTLQSSEEIGRGGRNLETALNAVRILDGLPNAALITLATDGEDGETNAAGAVVTGESFLRGKACQIQPENYLRNHDSYSYFEKLDDLLLPGLTRTNVNDLCFLFTF